MGPSRDQAEHTLSVVIPAYNEGENLRKGTLSSLAEYLAERGYEYELIVVDDGSQDDTAAQVQAFANGRRPARLIRQPHQGKAQAVTNGVLAASGRYVLFMDMDLSTSLEHVGEAVTALEEGADVVIGSREAAGAKRIGAPWLRRWLGKGFNYLVQLLLLPGLNDTQCGFKAFRREVAKEIFPRQVVFGTPEEGVKGPRVTAFDVELLVMARERGCRIKQIPVNWRYVKSGNVRPALDAYRMLKEVLLVWFNRLRGKYNHRRRDLGTP